MAWKPIVTGLQYEDANGNPYSGAVLKAYAAGTSSNIALATDKSGVTTASSIALNASGYPAVSGNIVLPHIDQTYKLALYPTQVAADADSGAIWTLDNITISGDFGSVTTTISTTTVLDSTNVFTHINATGTITITLPDIDVQGAGYVFTIRNAGTGTVTLDGDGAEQINGANTLILFPGDSALVQSSATAWSATGYDVHTVQNAQTGTSYALTVGDFGKLVTFSNGSAIAVSLAQAGTVGFDSGWSCEVQNLGVGTMTITPTTSTINGAASMAFPSGTGGKILSNGTNYFVQKGNPSLLDEDNMASDSATQGATQQSIKAYVDNKSASQAEMETATSTTQYASPGRLQYHPGVAKAWIMFNGTGTPADLASRNVTSITDNNTGDYTINYTTSFSSANYGISAIASEGSVPNAIAVCLDNSNVPAAGTTRIRVRNDGGGAVDVNRVSITAHGDQ